MAGVEAIGFGTVSSNPVHSITNAASVSADTNQFEHFLQDRKDSKLEQTADKDIQKNPSTSAYKKESAYSNQETIQKSEGSNTGQTYDMEKLAETAKALNEGVKEILKENLGVEEEKINSILKAMGIAITDLFYPQILQQFVLQLHGGEENMDFLMNESLLNDFSNLLQDLQSFLSEDMRDLLALMETMESPMALDDFLAQFEAVEEMSGVTQEAAVYTEATEQVDMTVAQNASEVQSVVRQENPDLTLVEKISVQASEESVPTQEMSSVSENMTESDSETNAFSKSMMSQDSSKQLFADTADSENVATPLFTEQFDAAQNDIGRLFTNNIPGNQRMQQMVDIVNQVNSSIRSALNADTTTMEVQLNPESLGKVFLSVVSKEGVMTATFHVQTEEAKNALESQIFTLKENLEAKNLKVESVDVQISDFSFSQSNGTAGQGQSESAEKGKKKFKFDSEISSESEISEEENAEQVRKQVMRDMGGSIDFTA